MPNPGATPTISANRTRDGIVWVIQTKPFGTEDRPAILRAFDAANVGRELWTSEQNSARDRAGTALRFTIPTVWGGKVYVGTQGGVDVYGLLASR
jgi:outer membrane protein assembly factor BamB